MISHLNQTDIINHLEEEQEILANYPESDVKASYESSSRSLFLKKLNELIDKVNELESRPPIIISYPNYYPHLPYTTSCDLQYMGCIP